MLVMIPHPSSDVRGLRSPIGADRQGSLLFKIRPSRRIIVSRRSSCRSLVGVTDGHGACGELGYGMGHRTDSQ
jgi:hypothetical protein